MPSGPSQTVSYFTIRKNNSALQELRGIYHLIDK